jgi:hypothetical protein
LSPQKDRPEYLIVSHAPVEKSVEKLRGIDAGSMKFSVELLSGDVAEVALWR